MNQEVKIIGGITILSLTILLVAVFFLSKPEAPSTPEARSELLIASDSNKIAADTAKVTLVEFGDYQCPACAKSNPQVKQLLKEYPGKLNFVYRHFPLPQHLNAIIAAEAAEAAGVQGKYWEMHDKLYSSQSEWSESQSPLSIFEKYAIDLGLDVQQLKKSVNENTFRTKIMADKEDGEALKVTSTPTFYLNGVKMQGFDYAQVKSAIEKADK